MHDPDPDFELKILRDVLAQSADPEGTLTKQRKFRKVLSTLGTIGLTVAFVLAMGGSLYGLLIAAVAGVSGIALGFAVYFKLTQDQWPITVRYVDLKAISERVRILESE